jgi:hypothetical protein
MTAFVLGNGQSRGPVDPHALAQQGTVYGCNALYRSFTPAVLVATDQPMAREIQDSGYSKTNVFYTRRPFNGSGARTVPREYFGFSSGPIAAAIAAMARHDIIYLVGFDMGPGIDGKFNNIYAGTPHYKTVGSHATFTGNWIKQLKRVMQDHALQRFVRVMGETTQHIAEFETHSNFQIMSMEHLLAQINISKDPK